MSDAVPLDLRELTVAYAGTRRAHVPRLTVPRGACVAIVGESGSGKTSVLKAVLGILPPDAATVGGSARVFGTEIVGSRRDARVRGADVGLIVQSPIASLNPSLRIGVWAGRILRDRGLSRTEARDRLRAAFADVNLDPSIEQRYAHQISGGQGQRVVIALALALDTRLLLADEPTSALDVTLQHEILTLFAELLQRGRTLLIVSHDFGVVSAIADYVLVMKDGEVIEEGLTADVMTAPRERYTRDLVDAVPRVGRSRVEVSA